MEIQKHDYIDALRGWAILGVIFSHVFGIIRTNNNFSTWLISEIGARGVQLFFIISACTLFLSVKSRSTHEANPNLYFFIRRFFRIAPLFYVVILYYVSTSVSFYGIAEIIAVFTFTNGWNPYWLNHIVPGQWTLAVEMIFYLMVPILFIKIKKISQAIIAFLILFSISWILIISFADQSLINNSRLWGLYMHRSPLAQFHFFFLGIILYFLITKDYIKNNFIYIRNILVLSILGSATLGLLAKIITSDFHTFYHVMILIESLIIFLGVMYLLRYKWKFFINSIINYIGKISYSIYLTHFILLNFLIEKMGSIYSLHGATINMTIWYWTLYIIYFSCGTIALASITYYGIEVPGQGLGKSIISTLSKKNHKSLSI